MQSNLERYNLSKHEPSNLTHRIKETKPTEYSRDKESLSLESMKYCARFDFCSAPKCPLDILISQKFQDSDDPKCEMAKATRHKYWESMPDTLKQMLPCEGYFESEFNRMRSARERWLALPEQKKAEIRERMRNVKAKGQ